ncbi:MAG: hypothetical protein EOO77_07165 [Oxalobacteraceae bacterium]|nr:MAG: hypothetical protein EOO77_07165 [Oxalobacteraceae bacterium]
MIEPWFGYRYYPVLIHIVQGHIDFGLEGQFMTLETSPLATFTAAFKRKFGSRAITVARTQVASAPKGEVQAVWQEILDDLIKGENRSLESRQAVVDAVPSQVRHSPRAG